TEVPIRLAPDADQIGYSIRQSLRHRSDFFGRRRIIVDVDFVKHDSTLPKPRFSFGATASGGVGIEGPFWGVHDRHSLSLRSQKGRITSTGQEEERKHLHLLGRSGGLHGRSREDSARNPYDP